MSQITNSPNTDLVLATFKSSAKERHKIEKLTDKLRELIVARRRLDKLEGDLKHELKEILKPAYFKYNEDVVISEEAVHTFDVNELQVNFVNAYFIKDKQHAQDIIELLGTDHPLTDHIVESQKITVDVTGLSEEDANTLARNITNDSWQYNIRPQVERKTVTSPEFHGLRHVILNQEDNLALDTVLPVQVQVVPIE
jgi:hypothetical protein